MESCRRDHFNYMPKHRSSWKITKMRLPLFYLHPQEKQRTSTNRRFYGVNSHCQMAAIRKLKRHLWACKAFFWKDHEVWYPFQWNTKYSTQLWLEFVGEGSLGNVLLSISCDTTKWRIGRQATLLAAPRVTPAKDDGNRVPFDWLSGTRMFTNQQVNLAHRRYLVRVLLKSTDERTGTLLWRTQLTKTTCFWHTANLKRCTVKQNLRFGERYTCFGQENKTGVERILVIFQHRPMFSHIIQKVSARAFHWCGWT